MKEIRFHGRGGQGAIMAAQILATAVFHEGRFSQASLSYTGERRGAPVLGFVRISNEPIVEKSKIYNPDYVVVLDHNLFKILDPFAGIKADGVALINYPDSPAALREKMSIKQEKLYTVDATSISEDIFGAKSIPLVNISILGAFSAITEEVKLGSILAVLDQFLPPEVIESNVKTAKLGYEKVMKEG